MSCLSCHTQHLSADDERSLEDWADDQLGKGMRGDQACVQCHGQEVYRTTAHTHHAPQSTGSRCYNCHMPHTTYGLLKGIRSHTVTSPTVAETVSTGRPNACNLCHLDQTLKWSARHLKEWYRVPQPKLSQQQETVAAGVLWTTTGDAGLRALAAWSMGWSPAIRASQKGWQAAYLAYLLDDPYDAVRHIALRSLRRQPGFEKFVFDFVGAADARPKAVQHALDIWNQAAGQRQSSGALLIGEQGRLDDSRLQTLRDSRDDTRITLAE